MSRKPPGQPSKLSTAQRAEPVLHGRRGPIPAVDGVVRWRLIGLAAWVWHASAISIGEATLSRQLNTLGAFVDLAEGFTA